MAGALEYLSRRLARPRCVFPGCSQEVANWVVGDYIPLDSDLCDTHHKDYAATWKDASADGHYGYPRSPNFHRDTEILIQQWIHWYTEIRKQIV